MNSYFMKVLLYLVFISSIFLEAKQTDLIPLSLLFNNPAIAKPRLSPDGTKIAFLAPSNGVMNIWIKSNNSTDGEHSITNFTRAIKRYWWGYDNKTIFYFQDENGNENWNLYTIDTATGIIKNLTPFPDVQVRLIGYSRKYPDTVLIGMNKDNKAYHDVYKVNINANTLECIEKNPGFIAGFDMEQAWYADNDLQIRIAMTIDDDGNTHILHRNHSDDEWKVLLTWDVNASAISAFVGFSHNTENAYFADASESENSQLIEINLQTKEKTVLAQDHIYDIISGSLGDLYKENSSFLKHPLTNKIKAVFLECDTYRTIILDDSLYEDIKILEQFNLGKLVVCSTDDSFDKWITMFIHSDRTKQYFLYDRITKAIEPIINRWDPLLDYILASMEPITFTARDGLTVHGYLTYPTNVQENQLLPLIVLVHGGPWARDLWGFNEVTQFLANRGYLCLQVNFRSSSGYGKSFIEKGNKEYGRGMQHDLTDGVKWLIDQGIVDAKRVAIMGRSYGGYAALAGATFTPDVYACAIDLYGRVNLVTNQRSIPPYWEKSAIVWKYRKGDPAKEESMLKERSPLFHADKIKIPLLIAHGVHDVRIKQTDSDKIVAALQEQSIPCEYLSFPGEGHGLSSIQSRMHLYKSIESFLEKYVGSLSTEQ